MKDRIVMMKNVNTTNAIKTPQITFTYDLNDYFKKVNSIESLDLLSEKELANRAKSGDINAKRELVQANLKLVVNIARKVIHVSKLPFADLIQEGNLGLMVAIEKFNPNLGYRFSTYATWWIKQAMFKAISEQSHCMKVPVYIQETLSKFSKIKQEMERNYNCQIKNSDVAKKMDIEPEKIDRYLNAYCNPISLEGSFDANNGSELSVAEIVADDKENIEEDLQYQELKKEIAQMITKLKEREQSVIKMRFGLEDFSKCTLEEIGKLYGVTKECIRQTENRALGKLKDLLVQYA